MKNTLTSFLLAFLFLMACNSGNDNATPQQEYAHPGKKNRGPARDNYHSQEDEAVRPDAGDEVIDRHPDRLIYTKHARCRMGCRHIDEAEVREILEKGRINYRKSEPAGRPDPKYALEGTTRDGQEVRIIFAPGKRGMVVITVIDLGTEWSCDCK
jgi:hypothetical protein